MALSQVFAYFLKGVSLVQQRSCDVLEEAEATKMLNGGQ